MPPAINSHGKKHPQDCEPAKVIVLFLFADHLQQLFSPLEKKIQIG
jgi:hypothetical protein